MPEAASPLQINVCARAGCIIDTMQASRTLARAALGLQRRAASGEAWMSRRWVEQTRREAGLVTIDDPPNAPLSADHDIGDGVCDFANWFDKGKDVSTSQALVGLGSALGFCLFVYKSAVGRAERTSGTFTLRETPSLANDFPSYDFEEGDAGVYRKGERDDL